MMEPGLDYGIRVIRAYSNQRVGNVIFPPALLRDRLVVQGFAERILPPTAKEVEPRRQRRPEPPQGD